MLVDFRRERERNKKGLHSTVVTLTIAGNMRLPEASPAHSLIASDKELRSSERERCSREHRDKFSYSEELFVRE